MERGYILVIIPVDLPRCVPCLGHLSALQVVVFVLGVFFYVYGTSTLGFASFKNVAVCSLNSQSQGT